jgi:ubiquinone/menaquinone biosynthesis C-methylase UbiE
VTDPGAGFDGLVRLYRGLEFAAFGRDLERARFSLLDHLAASRRILVLGEGDGRCLARLVRLAPDARIDCVDISAAMLRRAAARLSPSDGRRVTFHRLDARSAPLPAGPFDAVTTLFFLDCFTDDEVRGLVERIRRVLAPSARWLWADFRMPESGPYARARARAWIALLYAFFRWQTGISARALPAAEAAIGAAGLQEIARRDYQRGMVRAALFASDDGRARPSGGSG